MHHDALVSASDALRKYIRCTCECITMQLVHAVPRDQNECQGRRLIVLSRSQNRAIQDRQALSFQSYQIIVLLASCASDQLPNIGKCVVSSVASVGKQTYQVHYDALNKCIMMHLVRASDAVVCASDARITKRSIPVCRVWDAEGQGLMVTSYNHVCFECTWRQASQPWVTEGSHLILT